MNKKRVIISFLFLIFCFLGLEARLYNIQISSGPAIIEITTDGQASWHSINNGVEVGATSTFTAQELIDLGDAFNIRAKSAITLDRAIVRLV